MEKSGTIRLLCVGMIAAVLVLSLLMVVAICGGIPVLGEGDETVRKGFYDLLGEDPTGPLQIETIDWENMTMPPETTEEEGTLPAEPGMDDKAELDGDMWDTPILEVEPDADGYIYLKMQSYGDYTGQGWTEADAYDRLLDGASADFLPGSMIAQLTGASPYTLNITPLLEFSVLPYYALQVDGDDPVSDVKIEGNTTGPFRVWYYSADELLDYSQTAETFIAYERALRTHAYTKYLNVDAETKDYMRKIIDEQGFSADDPDIIKKVAKYIQKAATYDLEFDKAMEDESNVVIAFLDQYKVGVCRHYAAAATLLFRSLNIPARYTVGFAAQGTAGRTTVVKGADAHAWVEVYVNGFGWQQVEVTGSVEEEKPLVDLKLPDVHLMFDGTYQAYSGKVMGFEEYEAMGYRCEVAVEPAVLLRGQEKVSIKSVQIFDPNGDSVTDQFQVTWKTGHEGVFTVYYDTYTFKSFSDSKEYDGTPLTVQIGDIYIAGGKALPPNHKAVFIPEKMGSITNVGKSSAAFDVRILYTDEDGVETDVTEYFTAKYDIGQVNSAGKPVKYVALTLGFGQLEVTPRPITLTTGSATVRKSQLLGEPYNGVLTAHWIDEVEYSEQDPENPKVGLVGYDYIDMDVLVFTGLRRYEEPLGSTKNTIDHQTIVIRNEAGEDVTKNYTIKWSCGTLYVRAG